MPSGDDLETLEAAHDHIARLIGQVDRMTEVIGDTSAAPTQVQAPGLVATDPVNGGPETWHTLGTLAGASINYARFRMTPHGTVYLQIDVTFAGSTGAGPAFSVTLPSAYQPPGSTDIRSASMGQTNGTGGLARVFVGSVSGGSAGAVSMPALANLLGSYSIQFEYPVI